MRFENLGLVSYPFLIEKMEAAFQRQDLVCFLAHCEPCVTQGLRLVEEDWEASPLVSYRYRRGGGATVHSPGQLLLFPVAPLRLWGRLRDAVPFFLKVWQKVCEEQGLTTRFKDQDPGLWVEDRKLAFVGLACRRQWLLHGLSFNVINDLSFFQGIRPCGSDQKVTTLAHELKLKEREHPSLWQQVCQSTQNHLRDLF